MPVLTKEQILGADDSARETVAVKEWGGEVIVAAMSGEDRDAYESALVSGPRKNLRAMLVAACVVDEAGARLFSAEDVSALGRKSARALDRVVRAAQRVNGLTPEAMKELEGN